MTDKDQSIISDLSSRLSYFNDFKGLYFFGSRLNETARKDSDYDVALIFENYDYNKNLEIAGVIADLEYEQGVFIDYKRLSITGNRSIDFIRKYSNPLFIQHAIDQGKYYGRSAEENFNNKCS